MTPPIPWTVHEVPLHLRYQTPEPAPESLLVGPATLLDLPEPTLFWACPGGEALARSFRSPSDS